MNKYRSNLKRIQILICTLLVIGLNESVGSSDTEKLDHHDQGVISNLLSHYATEPPKAKIVLQYKDFNRQAHSLNKEGHKEGVNHTDLVTFKSGASSAKSTLNIINEAYKAFDMGHYEVALSIYEQAQHQDPKNMDVKFGIAVIYQKLGLIDKAKKSYSSILTINPSHKHALNNYLSIIAYEKPDAALDALRRLEAAEPRMSVIPAQIASIYQRQGNFDLALRYLKKAYKLEPSKLEYIYNLGMVYEKMNQKNNAMAIYTKVIEVMNQGYKSNVSYQEVSNKLARLNKIKYGE